MYKRYVCPFIFTFLFILQSLAAGAADIDRAGKRIQLDGFLLDWMSKDRRPWLGSDGWWWDALNTPEGVSGYMTSGVVSCTEWTFFIEVLNGRPRLMSVDVPGAGTWKKGFVCSNRVVSGTSAVISVEWVIPWDSLCIDSAGSYAVRLSGISACGDTLRPMTLTGTGGGGRDLEAPGAVFWGILAAASAAVFLAWLTNRIRGKYHRRRTHRRE